MTTLPAIISTITERWPSIFAEAGHHCCFQSRKRHSEICIKPFSLITPFVTVRSLANQTVAIRTKAIADLYFSSEAYDDYGPEHDSYDRQALLEIPDPRDWEIIEALQDGVGLEDFAPADVQRIQSKIMITDEQYAELVAEGRIKSEDLETEKKENEKETESIFKLASRTTYQLSTGQQRDVHVDDEEALYNAFYELIEFNGQDAEDDMILLRAEGRHRTIFINKAELDYVSLPTHKYEAGAVDAMARDMEGFKKAVSE